MQNVDVDLNWLDRSQKYRTQVLRWMSLVMLVACLAYGAINLLLLDQVLLGTSELVFAIYSAFIYNFSDKFGQRIYHPVIFVSSVNLMVLLAILSTPTSVTLFVWLFICPILVYLLLGKSLGFKVNALLVPISIIVNTYAATQPDSELLLRSSFNVAICLLAVWAIAHVYERNRENTETMLTSLALVDPLTNIDNRLSLALSFEKMASIHRRKTDIFSMLVIDIDYFKKINDTYGHSVGDEVLKQVAKLLAESVRVSDSIYRVGGEEFCALLPYTDGKLARATAEHVRKEVAFHQFEVDEHQIQLSVSIGIAEYGQDGVALEEMFKTADDLLYNAKGAGRNKVAYGT
ncbi:GGDEF domain-containing protein [Vibrio sp. SCSIO 43136]|uniref:GGDEF domain-containing protein n=1 Tax=Vibrio sp. SCSIO 43136 TaxID=2819101 RepID=UPI0020763173|nr:GGDEF domain-containing protein [Vibrio sp. SCSIO 43136]USD67667.1 GGDEF domain-containing protein [Vibrio sp. SCSIO 43136]